MSVAFDVTKDKETQELLTKERLQFEATLLSVGDGVICTNKHGEITLINKIYRSKDIVFTVFLFYFIIRPLETKGYLP